MYFSIFYDIPSQPADLVVSSSDNSSKTDSSVHRNSFGQSDGGKQFSI